ncbi:GGDEF domain-containing protein [Nitrosospira sp. NpAV]|uniref:GGDEF domain-containing protein n=1 Tax=Nitrosospira sp. NpAV TaxID=58133 RepID=UPI00069804F2|nr:GGDEF domain-containing protein [Nitrosospira sp. NpAV]
MTSDHDPSPTLINNPPLLEKALEKSQEVKDKVEKCADELSTVNETIKKEMAAGITLCQAEKALAQSESVEDKVHECAGELNEVNDVLAQEIDDRNKLNRELIETLQELSTAQNVLSDPQDVLAIAQEVVGEAKQRTLRDFVTGIPNRELFDDRLDQAIALAKRCNWILAVMFIDLDGFKKINDTHGHAIGDRVLQVVAQRLYERVRGEDTVCRYGGDEFLYLLVNPQSTGNIQRIARNVFDRISQVLLIDDLRLIIEPSIGIAVYPDDGSTAQELVANADAAMYRAKGKKAGCIFFTPIL